MILLELNAENFYQDISRQINAVDNVLYVNLEDNSEADKNLNLTHIEFSDRNKKLIIKASIGNIYPLFWGWDKNRLIVGDSPSCVLKKIKSSNKIDIDDFDKVAILESMIFDGPLSGRTLFKNVHKVQSAQQVEFNLANQTISDKWLWLPKLQNGEIVAPDQIDQAAAHAISTLMDNIKVDSTDVILPITGGLDSRLLAALIRRRFNGNIHSYTFQRGWSLETWCAKKVAKQIEAGHATYNLDERCYKDAAREVVKKTGGLITGMHVHGIFCCENLLSESLQRAPRIFGFYGDPVTGAMTETVEFGQKIKDPLSVFEKYNHTLFPTVVDKYKEEILHDLEETHEAFKQSNSPNHCFHEFWKIQQRQNNLVTHLFNYHRVFNGVEVIEPFVKQEFIDLFLGLPFQYRFNRNLFKKITQRLYPDIFNLPSIHFENNSLLAKFEQVCEKIEAICNKINPTQEFFLSPFKYEQHEKNLQNYLREDVLKGVDLFSEIFNCKKVTLSYPVWKVDSSVKEHYRLASLHYLLS